MYMNDATLEHLKKIITIQSYLANAKFDINEFINLVVSEVQNLTSATGVVIEMLRGTDIVYRAATGTVAKHVGLSIPVKNSISGLCLNEKKILYSRDTEQDQRVNLEACRKVNARSLVVAPLFHNKIAVGVLKILSDQPNAFTQDDIDTLELITGLIGGALGQQIIHSKIEKNLEQKTSEVEALHSIQEKLEQMTNFDYVTNLPYSNLFVYKLDNALENAKRYNFFLAVLLIDIDQFNKINETIDRVVADSLLINFVMRLKKCLKETYVMARYNKSGDEFLIFFNNLPSKNTASEIAEKIIHTINEPFPIDSKTISITASIGISFYENKDINAISLIQQSSKALEEAKKTGNTFKIYVS